MNRRSLYFILVIFFLGACAFVVLRYNKRLKSKEVAFYPLMERKGPLAYSPEWTSAKSESDKLIRIIRETPWDTKTALALSSLYIREARITGNYMYYDGAALKYLNEVLDREPANFEAMILKSLIYLSQHHFADGLVIAERAQKINPYNSFAYGILVDGNVEMGNYKAAVENSDKMVSIRPDIRSYSRISYLREIHGDYPGAIEAMKMAVDAGGYGDEATEWARIQLARLYENTGDLKRAEMYYTMALDERPGYAYAIGGLGHIAMVNNDYKKAIALYEQADSLVNDYSFKDQLSELYSIIGEAKKSNAIINNAIAGMTNDAMKGQNDASIGHYADRELAYSYLLIKDYDRALQHALAEYDRRPENIDVNETVAWVYYKKEDYQKAIRYIQTALKTNCKNPTLLCRAGLIYSKTGNLKKAKETLQEALKNNPAIDPQLKTESENVLRSL